MFSAEVSATRPMPPVIDRLSAACAGFIVNEFKRRATLGVEDHPTVIFSAVKLSELSEISVSALALGMPLRISASRRNGISSPRMLWSARFIQDTVPDARSLPNERPLRCSAHAALPGRRNDALPDRNGFHVQYPCVKTQCRCQT